MKICKSNKNRISNNSKISNNFGVLYILYIIFIYFQVTKINNHISKECVDKENDSYLKMLPITPAHAVYPYSSCVCVSCGNLFQTPELLMDHWDHSPKCNVNNRQACGACKASGLTDPKMCKHYAGHELPRVMLVDSSHDVINYDQSVQTDSSQNDFSCINTRNYNLCPDSSSKTFDPKEDEKIICPMPPPPEHDPHKPLPYRIDFLLNSGVIKHAKMNINGKSKTSLYFEKKRPRKPRTHFTDIQIEDLEKVFEDKKYLSANERQIIASDLSLQEEQVKNWFQNRRSRWRKDCKDAADEMPPNEQLNHMIRSSGHETDCQREPPVIFHDDKTILQLQS